MGSGCPVWLGIDMKVRIRRVTLEENLKNDTSGLWASMPQAALLCEEAWGFAHQLWTKTEMNLLPAIGFWPSLSKALREEAHAKLVQLTSDLRKDIDSPGCNVDVNINRCTLNACEDLKDRYDNEIQQFHRVVPATYVCAICGNDDSDHVHDARVLETYTLACGHQACSRNLAGWLQSQLNGGTLVAGLQCPFRDPQTGSRCNESLSAVYEGGVSNLPQMLQELLPHDLSSRVFQLMAEASPNLIFCPRSTCSAAWWLENEELSNKHFFTRLTCASCQLTFCCKCPHGPHPGKTCEQEERERASRRDVDGTTEDQRLLGTFSKPCPKCGSMTLKDGGCRHMTCPCGAHWCWECNQHFPQQRIVNHMFSVHNGWYDDRTNRPLNL